MVTMHMLKLQRLTANLGKTAWNDISSMHVPDMAALGVLHSQIMAQELRTLNRKFVSSLRNNIFGIKPRTGRHGHRLQLLHPLLYSLHIDALLQYNEEELDSFVWVEKPWRMPAVKAWAAILRLATGSEGIGTGMFLADITALIDASSAPDGMTAHELDARAEGVFKVCDQFTSVSALKDFMRSCLRAEVIKSVAARGDKISYAHGQANNFLITKRLEGGGLSLKDTQYALDLAARFMAEQTKPTRTLARIYLTAAADPELNTDEKKEQKQHIAMLLSFYETHKNDGDRSHKGGRGDGDRGRGHGHGGGRGENGGGDGGGTHLSASIMLNLFPIANASARRPPALPPFSLPSPAINLAMAPLPLIIFVCLILTPPTLHVCLLLQHPQTLQHHRPLPHSGLILCLRLPLAMLRSTVTRRKAPYSIAAPR